MEWLSTLADTIGVLTLFAWLNTRRLHTEQQLEQERLNQKIQLRLQTGDGQAYIDLPGEMRPGEVTRAEI